jgi:hypothetical protein
MKSKANQIFENKSIPNHTTTTHLSGFDSLFRSENNPLINDLFFVKVFQHNHRVGQLLVTASNSVSVALTQTTVTNTFYAKQTRECFQKQHLKSFEQTTNLRMFSKTVTKHILHQTNKRMISKTTFEII